MGDALSNIRTRNVTVPQSEQADERQVRNNAGGYVFEVSGEDRIKRFLCLGTDGGSYYSSERDLTRDNAAVVIDWAKNRSSDLVLIIRDISVAGRAPKQNPALFALAAVFAFGDAPGKKLAQAYFNDIVRTGTHLFLFVKYAEQFRGWGRGLKRTVANWYTSKDPRDLSYQLVKYRQREGWTHRDILRSAHPKTDREDTAALLTWAAGKEDTRFAGPLYWTAPYETAQEIGRSNGKNKADLYADLIRTSPGLPREALPDDALGFPVVWEALLDAGMPVTALIRNLPKMTSLGLLSGSYGQLVASQLTDADRLRKGRVHPVSLLYALKTYASGHSVKGSGSWTPERKITDALDGAFYASFGTIEPAGKRTLLCMDVSASMTWTSCGNIMCSEGAMAMAMATAASEPGYEIMGFCHELRHLDISPRRRLDDNLRTIRNMSFGGTDCALPMQWALDNKMEFDTFAVYTDNETWAGKVHPHTALQRYRDVMGIGAKLVVVGMASNGFTIADPSDTGMLDVAGFDSAVPNIISGFSRGDFG